MALPQGPGSQELGAVGVVQGVLQRSMHSTAGTAHWEGQVQCDPTHRNVLPTCADNQQQQQLPLALWAHCGSTTKASQQRSAPA